MDQLHAKRDEQTSLVPKNHRNHKGTPFLVVLKLCCLLKKYGNLNKQTKVQIDSSTFWAGDCVIFFLEHCPTHPWGTRHRPEDFWVTLSAFKMTKGSKPHQGIESNGLATRRWNAFQWKFAYRLKKNTWNERFAGSQLNIDLWLKGDESNFRLPSFSGAFRFCHLPDPSEPVKSWLHSVKMK